jgi:hypothetical protein
LAQSQPEPADEPGWPDDSAEAAFLADRPEADPPAAPAETGPGAVPEGDPLPPLDGLVQRVPENVRAALDDLFRAKFTGVRRLPPEVLK